MNTQPFIRGDPPRPVSPLLAYLPVYRPGIVTAWLDQFSSGSGLILCPFGSSPQIAIEAARNGLQVLIPVHNPILRFLIESLANPPSREELGSALAKLSSSYKGKDRLQPLLLSLYETDCPQCGGKTSASSFIWSRQSREPVRKTCRCIRCGEETFGDVNGDDIQKAAGFQDNSPIHARALTRVAAPDDPIRYQVENALSSYPPRSVYALFTVLNKLASFNPAAGEKSHFETLLLHAFYQCSQPLDPRDPENENGEFYREENAWFALEDAVDIWSGDEDPLPVTRWPDLPPETGGVCLFPGRTRELIPELEGIQLQSIVMVFPKPTPSFWALSALWTGWLWGQDAAAPLRSILSIKNFDWPWMTKAIDLTLTEIHQVLPSGIPCFGLLPDIEIRSLLSSISAAANAGFKLEYTALDPDLKLGQTGWSSQKGIFGLKPSADHREIIRLSGFNLLRETGEPKHTLSIYNAGMKGLAAEGFPWEDQNPDTYFPRLLKDFEDNIAYRQGFLHYPESESWWHQELDLPSDPQADRLEKCLVELLVKAGEPLSEYDIHHSISREFPGQLTPRAGLIKACLESYAQPAADKPSSWVLKSNEIPGRRLGEIEKIEAMLRSQGTGLGYTVRKIDAPGKVIHLLWKNERSPSCSFFISASGMLGRLLLEEGRSGEKRWIIMPGSRAGLVHYKLRNNPPLAERIEDGWGLVKFRHIRRLVESNLNFIDSLDLDPFESDSPQLPLI